MMLDEQLLALSSELFIFDGGVPAESYDYKCDEMLARGQHLSAHWGNSEQDFKKQVIVIIVMGRITSAGGSSYRL